MSNDISQLKNPNSKVKPANTQIIAGKIFGAFLTTTSNITKENKKTKEAINISIDIIPYCLISVLEIDISNK